MILALLTKKTRLCLCRGFFVSFFLLFPLLLFSCASNNSPVQEYAEYVPSESHILWQKVDGAEFASYFFYENPQYPVRYHCVKIDLSKKITILTFPNSENDFSYKNGSKTDFFTGMTAKQFSARFAPVVAVNSAPFKGKWEHRALSILSSTRKIIGIHVARKAELSPPAPQYSAIAFKKDGEGWQGSIFRTQDETDFSEYDFVFGGFFTILTGGKKEEFSWKTNDSRTAMGLSADKKTLYLLVVEGENKKKSRGLSYPECADILLSLGASDALQMDGGGSSSLYINEKNALSYATFRKNAVFIGFGK